MYALCAGAHLVDGWPAASVVSHILRGAVAQRKRRAFRCVSKIEIAVHGHVRPQDLPDPWLQPSSSFLLFMVTCVHAPASVAAKLGVATKDVVDINKEQYR